MIASEITCYNIDIAALSETRFLDEGSLKEEGEVTLWVDNISTVWDWQLRTTFNPASPKHL